MHQCLYQHCRAGHKRPGEAQGLAERGHHEGCINLIQGQLLQGAASFLSQDTEAVGIVHVQAGPVFPAQAGIVHQWRQVPVHAEYRFADHQAKRIPARLQSATQCRNIGMGKTPECRPGQDRPVYEGGVAKAIHEYAPPARLHQGGDHGQVRLKAVGK